jgi:hypothetical protein
MLKSLSIKNFRLFRDLRIEPLNRVNLIAGENNSGKTAVLEALFLLFVSGDQFRAFPQAFRSGQGYPDDYTKFWHWLFYQKSFANPPHLEAICLDDTAYAVEPLVQAFPYQKYITFQYYLGGGNQFSINATENGEGYTSGDASGRPQLAFFSTHSSHPGQDADQFNRIAARKGGRKRLVYLLRVVEPRLQDLQYLKLGNEPLVYADLGMEDLIPTTQLGAGFLRLLRLYSEILTAEAKIVLIDEVENGIHYSSMEKVWKGIAAVAREEDLQVFATTHSYECIRSAHQSFSSGPGYDLALHRLEVSGDQVKAVTYNQTTLATSIDMNLEVR